MDKEDRIKAAQSKLDEAVEEFILANGWTHTPTGEPLMLTSWVMVAHQHAWDGKGEPYSSHPVVYMGGSQPDHVALGLLQIGTDTIRGIGYWVREEEDET